MAKTYYEVLGVDKNATSDEIKKAFHKLARKHHPDAGGDEETFKEINEAYSVLSDPEKRKQYDEFGQYGMPGGAYGGAGGRPGGTWTYTTGAGGNFNWEDILRDYGGFGGGGSSWSDIFGGAGRGAQRQQVPAKGRELQSTLEVTFEEAFSGTTKDVKLRNPDSGEMEEVRVKVPAGAVDGGKLRYKHKGGYAKGDGERGDLVIITKILPHKVFERKKADVLMTLPITPAEAALGAKITVPLPAGGKVKIKVPAGAKNGKVLVLSGKGAPKVKGQGNGDLKITLQITVPNSLTAQQKKAYENLATADEESGTSVRPQIDAAVNA